MIFQTFLDKTELLSSAVNAEKQKYKHNYVVFVSEGGFTGRFDPGRVREKEKVIAKEINRIHYPEFVRMISLAVSDCSSSTR